MPEKISKNSIGIKPYSDCFLRKAVLGYQLFLLRKEGVADNINYVHVVVSIPRANSENSSVDEIIIEWFKKELNITCNAITKNWDSECYKFAFTYY